MGVFGLLQERRWRALGAHIQRLGGVLSAEEMAPFLDPPPLRYAVVPVHVFAYC